MKPKKIKHQKHKKKPHKTVAAKKIAYKAELTKTTTVFTNGQSQAIRIPKEFRVRGKKVYIKKTGNCLMIIPMDDPWKPFFEAMGEFSDDFMKDGREILPDQERDWSGVFE